MGAITVLVIPSPTSSLNRCDAAPGARRRIGVPRPGDGASEGETPSGPRYVLVKPKRSTTFRRPMTVALLSIGTELTRGEILNTSSSWLAAEPLVPVSTWRCP